MVISLQRGAQFEYGNLSDAELPRLSLKLGL